MELSLRHMSVGSSLVCHLLCLQTNFHRYAVGVESRHFPKQITRDESLMASLAKQLFYHKIRKVFDIFPKILKLNSLNYLEAKFARIFRIKVIECHTARLLLRWCWFCWRSHRRRKWRRWNRNEKFITIKTNPLSTGMRKRYLINVIRSAKKWKCSLASEDGYFWYVTRCKEKEEKRKR